MKKMWKRFVSLLLACTLLAGMLPLSASAAEKPGEDSEQYKYAENILNELNGSLEQSEQYTLNGPYQLEDSEVYIYELFRSILDDSGHRVTDTRYVIVPGKGATQPDMPDYENGQDGQPWAESNPSAVYIAKGVTGIGNHAFDGMTTLETLEIQNPDSLTRIGEHAFNGCDKLVGPLDLSGVTDMGKYAFNGCERLGSGEDNEGVKLSDSLTEIPEYAFNGCGLKNVNIPTNCTEIGNNAFANNSLSGELNLPSSLITIGERAFYRYNSSSDTGGFSSITIPSSVTEIGANAFSGHKSLETVTLEHEDKETLTIKDGAFGTDTYTAHNYLDSIIVDGITYENVSMGTQFLTKNDVGELLNNGVNCYLGDLKPLEYKRTVLPTCMVDGYYLYTMTLKNVSTDGKPVTIETQIPIQHPGHNYEKKPNLSATCTYPERTLEVCTNVENNLVKSCEAPRLIENVPGSNALGHDYQVTNVTNPTISNNNPGDTVITYTCANAKDKLHDGDVPAECSWKIEPVTLTASTSHTLKDLESMLPAVIGVEENMPYAHLEWNEDEDTQNALLEAGTPTYKVKLVFTGTETTFPSYSGENFKITVQVDKIKLDFSDVTFINSTRYTGLNNSAFDVEGLPEGVTEGKIEYQKDGENTWTTTPPFEASAAHEANYKVRVHFTYDSGKYLMPGEDETSFLPSNDYALEGSEGKGTITGDYIVRALQPEDLTATPKTNLVYNGEERATATIGGLPQGAKVTVTWEEKGEERTETIESAESSSYDVAKITDAGTYDITITVEHSAFVGNKAEVKVTGNIAKQTVITPISNTNLLPYTPETEQIGVPDSSRPNVYEVENNKQTNAGTYQATATLSDPDNYKWSTSEEAAVQIQYTIPRRRLTKPALTNRDFVFRGESIMPLQRNNPELSGNFDPEGKLKAYWTGYGEEHVAYTATNARKTDADTYRITVSLNNGEAQNYWWNDGTIEDYTLEWTITPMQIQAPEVEVKDATYTGEDYDAALNIRMTGSSEYLSLGTEHTYYRSSTGSTPLGSVPKDAGTYYVQVDFDFKEGLNPENYTITGNNRQPFTIEKAELTLTAPTEDLEVSYTGLEQLVPAPIITGLYGSDTCTLSYSYLFTPENGEQETQPNTAEGELKVSAAGTYVVTVTVPDTCQNYQAKEAVKYTFIITSAIQRVELESSTEGWNAEQSTVSKTLGNAPFTVTGKGYVNDVVVNEDDIDYKVTGGDTQNPVVEVDPTRGEVTLLRAGSATITVTAEGSANYQKATATYTITVGKGTPTVEVQMPEGDVDNTYSYTGEALTFDATVTGAPDAVEPVKEEKVSFKFYQDNNDSKGAEISGGQPTGIGTYWVEAVYEGDDNYNEATSTAEKFTISPAALNVAATGYTDTYNGGEHDPVKSITVTGVDGVISPEKYTISYAKKTSDQPPEADGNWSSTLQVKDVADSGDYWIKVVIRNDDSYAPYIGSVKVTIDPKPLTVTKTVKPTKEYDGTTKATVDFDTITTGITGELVTADLISAVYNSPNVEEADTITITYQLTAGPNTDLANYSLDGEAVTGAEMGETVTEGVGITPASITVAINDQTSVYDGEEPDVAQGQGTSDGDTKNWYVSEGTIYNSDNLGIALSIAPGSKDAGTYAIIGEADNDNYKVTFTGNWKGEEGDPNNDHAGTYTIDPRPIDVKIGDAEGFYGDAPVLTGVELTYEGTDEENHRGLAPGENSVPNITLGTGASAQSPVAGYVIYAVDGNNDRIQKDTPVVIGNYNVTFTNEGTYTVKPRPITITIKDHSSKYGAEINGGIADPLSDKDYTVAITAGNTVTGGAIVNGDDLGITLFTTAKKGDNAGTYPISGEAKAESSVVSNYAITWKGENPFIGEGEPDSTKATYTVEKAELTVKAKQTAVYAQYGQETANPLTFTNASTGEEITVDDSNYETLENAVTYTLNPADSLTMETENKAEGKFTVNVTDTTVTVEVNVAETDNFKAATKITYDVYTSASGSLTVDLPFADLTYTSEEQKLLTGAPTLPGGVVIRYKLGEKGAWTEYSDADPSNWQTLVGTGAGDYTVYWETKAGGNYNASSGHETTEIKKADLSATYTGLNGSEVTLVLNEMGDTYTIPLDLTGNKGYTHSNGDGVTFLSGNTDVAIAKNSTATLELRGVAGEAKITINCPGDNNYNPGTFTFTVTVTDQKAEILYDVTGTTRDYNGQPQTIAVKVTAPASGATVMYWNEKTSAYDLSEPPAYTDVQDDGYTIKFRITAPGYNTVTDKATLKIEPKPIEEDMIAGIAESYTYTGKGITFDDAISVHDKGVLLKQNTDYTVSYDQNTAVGSGTVTITGTGNYKESVTKEFNISPVDASDLTASLNRTFGYYGDSYTNNATVTVTHGRHTVASREITLTVTRQDSTIESGDVVQEGLKLTFNKAGIYTIHVEVSGTHKGAFDLTYTLLPQDVASDDFQVATDPVDRVWTYDGGNRAFDVIVTSDGTSLQKDVDFTLRYTYLSYVGSQEENEYDPEGTEFTEAGIYTVIVEGTGNYTGHAELVALIQPRDLSDAGITAAFAQTELVYNGEAQEPGVTLTYNGTPINQLKNTEYYGNTNAGEAQALSAASEDCNNFTGARVDAFIIEKKSLNDSTITAKADPEKYYYTGYQVTPAVTVTDSGRNADLSIGADYTVSSDAVGPGKVTATVTGTGNYKDTVKVEFTILPTGAEPVETLNLTVTPSEWTWDNGQTKAAISVTFNGTELNDADYELTVSKDGETPQTVTKEQAVELLSAPGKYTITATGMDAYAGSTDTETVTIKKIQPEVTVTATPNSLSGGGKVTLTLKGEKLPDGTDLKNLLKVTAKNDNDVTLEDLHIQWPEDGSLTAELTLPNTNETYTFALSFAGNDYYEPASSDAMVVVGQQTSGGGGGSDPGDQPADPDDTGVSDWLNTKDHLAYLAGYPGGTFGPDQNMTRAEAAQMFYNLLLEKDVKITVEFEDVPADAWYAKPVNTLASLGILSGVGNGRFDPERSITRAEFTVIAMKFANTSGGGVNIFSDVNEDDWFYSAVVDSTQYGWINGYPDGTFRPEATISRAEVTVIVNHMLGRAADRPYVIAHEEELNTFGDVNRGHWGYFHVAEATNAHEYHTEDGTESWTGLS